MGTRSTSPRRYHAPAICLTRAITVLILLMSAICAVSEPLEIYLSFLFYSVALLIIKIAIWCLIAQLTNYCDNYYLSAFYMVRNQFLYQMFLIIAQRTIQIMKMRHRHDIVDEKLYGQLSLHFRLDYFRACKLCLHFWYWFSFDFSFVFHFLFIQLIVWWFYWRAIALMDRLHSAFRY